MVVKWNNSNDNYIVDINNNNNDDNNNNNNNNNNDNKNNNDNYSTTNNDNLYYYSNSNCYCMISNRMYFLGVETTTVYFTGDYVDVTHQSSVNSCSSCSN